MNKKTYQNLQVELWDLLREALPSKVEIARIKEIEEKIAKYENIYELCQTILNEMLTDSDTISLAEIKRVCNFLTNDDEEELRDYEFSIPLHRERSSDDYPIWETLLMLRWPNSSVVSFVKVDDDEYQYVYSYLDL